jgi:hypothetical protein
MKRNRKTRSATPIDPMILGNMRANGVRSLDVTPWLCHHQAVLRPGRTGRSSRRAKR